MECESLPQTLPLNPNPTARAGHAWTTDYGNPDEVEAFEWIYPYSPVHNVRRPIGGTRQYPAMLLTTGTLKFCAG